jgi:hypothetical protein
VVLEVVHIGYGIISSKENRYIYNKQLSEVLGLEIDTIAKLFYNTIVL